MLNPTPPQHLVNADGQPYFLWDSEMTLSSSAPASRIRTRKSALLAGKLMRQAKPDDVFTFISAREIRLASSAIWKKREFWTWLFETWEAGACLAIGCLRSIVWRVQRACHGAWATPLPGRILAGRVLAGSI